MDPGDDRRYIPVRLNDTEAVRADIAVRHGGLELAPRAVETALRRKQLKFYQFGNKRFVTPEHVDEWLESCLSSAAPVANPAAQ